MLTKKLFSVFLGNLYFCYTFYGNSAAGASLSRLKHVKEGEVIELINESDIWGEFHCPYRHDALQQAWVRFRRDLPLHWPFLHYRCDLGIIHIEDAEAGHVDATETIRLQVDGHQVLLGHNSNQRVCRHWGVLDGSSSQLRRTTQELIKLMLNWDKVSNGSKRKKPPNRFQTQGHKIWDRLHNHQILPRWEAVCVFPHHLEVL